MQKCLELAKKGKGYISPNPMVGCIVVLNNKIIGEGYHKLYGDARAEVNAIESVKEKSLLKNATLYVNLEPCTHFGKTPPCSDLIIKHKIPEVVIGTTDNFLSHFNIQKLSDLPTIDELGTAGLIDTSNVDSKIFGTGKFYKEKQDEKKEGNVFRPK